MREFYKKYNIWLNIGTFLMFAGLLILFAIFPLERKIEGNLDAIQKKIIDNEIDRARIDKIPEMEKARTDFLENRNNLRILLSNENKVDFIKKMEVLADETGNRINLKIQESVQSQKISTAKKDKEKEATDILGNLPYAKYLQIQINLEGDYGQLLNFIHKLENMSYYVTVISLNLTKGEASKPAGSGENTPAPSSFQNNNPASNAANAKEKQDVALPAKIIKSTLEVVVYLEE